MPSHPQRKRKWRVSKRDWVSLAVGCVQLMIDRAEGHTVVMLTPGNSSRLLKRTFSLLLASTLGSQELCTYLGHYARKSQESCEQAILEISFKEVLKLTSVFQY